MKKAYILFVSMIILLANSYGWAATYYVRADASGANNGSDWTNAYTNLPASLQRGSTYYVSDGDYGTGEKIFDDQVSGAQYIYIKKATILNHGTSAGWQDSYGDGTAYFGSFRFSKSYYVIDGTSRTNPTSGYGFKLRGSSASQRLIFLYNGGGANQQPSDIIIKYVEMEHRGRNTETSDDAVYGLDYGVGGPRNITIQYCYIHDLGREAFVMRGWNNVLIEHSWIARNSNSAVNHSQAVSSGNSNNVIIRYNMWEDIEGTAVFAAMWGAHDNWEIYGNVFFHSFNYGTPPNDEGVGGIIRVINDSSNSGVATNWKIFNNTFANIKGLWSGIRIDAGSNNFAYNNLWYNCVRTAHYQINISHSWYYNTEPDGDTSNVQYGTENPFASLAGKNFRLRSATNTGFPLASPYNADMDGRTRGADGQADRGAFEFNSGSASMRAPGNFRITN